MRQKLLRAMSEVVLHLHIGMYQPHSNVIISLAT